MPQETQTLYCNICGFQSSRPGVTECPQCGQRNQMTTLARIPGDGRKVAEKEEKQSKTDKK